MAKLLGGTRIYGNATVDSTLTVANIAGNIITSNNIVAGTTWNQGTGQLQVVGNAGISGNTVSTQVYNAGSNNLLTYSEQFDNAVWTKLNATITANTVSSPDGTTTADTLTVTDASNIRKYVDQAQTPTGATVFSVYAKAGTYGIIQISATGDAQAFVNFNISTGVTGSSGTKTTGSIVSVGNGWFRCSAAFNSSTSYPGGTTFRVSFQSAITDGFGVTTTAIGTIYLWGAQLEVGQIASTYTPTTSAAVTTTNRIYVGSGNAAAPGLTFNSDASTGVWSPGANTLAISTSGAEKIRVDTSGNVGIGTSSPAYKLEVTGTSYFSDNLGLAAQKQLRLNGPADGAQSIRYNATLDGIQIQGYGGIAFLTSSGSGTERVRISANGGFSIGTTTDPGSGAITATGNITGANIIATSTTNATSTTTGAVIVSGGLGVAGNSYIGNTTIKSNLAYVAPNGANTITSQMLNGGTLAWSGNAGQLFSITDNMTGNIFSVNDVSGMPLLTANANGTVQIVYNANVGNLGTAGFITATGNITGGNLIGIFANGNSNISIPAANGNITIATAGSERVRVDTSGNVGIGTSSPGTFGLGAKFVVAGSLGGTYVNSAGIGLVLDGNGANIDSSIYFRYSSSATISTDSYLVFKTGSTPTERVRIASTGGFSIGTTTDPGSGAITATGNITGANLITGGVLSVTGNANIGNIGTSQLTATGNVALSGANVSLGAVGNVKITGGTTGQYLQTDGSGNLSWAAISNVPGISNGTSNVNIATSGGNITMAVNGTASVVNVSSSNVNVAGTLNATTAIIRNSQNVPVYFYQSNTAPTTPLNGDQWYDTYSGILFEYLNDGSTTQWVDVGTVPLPNLVSANSAALLTNVSSTGTVYTPFISGTANGNYSLISNTAYTANLANGSLNATLLGGTLTTAAQPNVTSLGTLSGVTATGNITGANLIGVFANGNSNISIPASNGNITMATAGSERLRIDTSGNVGIGTSSPSSILHVSKGDSTNATLIINQADDPTISASRPLLSLRKNNVTGFNISCEGTSGFTGLTYYAAASSTGQHVFLTNNNERARIDSSGNVGIGNSSPTTTLAVNGTAYISGNTQIASLGVGTAATGNAGEVKATLFTETSSMILKENFRLIEDPLSKVLQLTGFIFDRKDNTSKDEVGLIAEDVHKVMPNLVKLDKNGNPESVAYTRLTVYLLEAIKTLQNQIDELKSK